MLIYLTFVLLLVTSSQCSKNYNDIDDDMPTKRDLVDYLRILGRVVKFSQQRKFEISVNYAIGFALCQANLINVVNNVRLRLPKSIYQYLWTTSNKMQELLDYVYRRYKKSYYGQFPVFGVITDAHSWSKRIKAFISNRRKITNYQWPPFALRRMYLDWDSYVQRAGHMEYFVPSPIVSDYCLGEMAENEEQECRSPCTRCYLTPLCSEMLLNGTKFGYSLTHRYLFLALGNYNRACYVTDVHKDRQILSHFCDLIYDEANYIAQEGYQDKSADLLFEQIALCGLHGRGEFIRRSWLSRLARFQTELGCFSESVELKNDFFEPEPPSRRWMMVPNNMTLMYKPCNAHITGVGTGAFGTAVRFLAEMYYS